MIEVYLIPLGSEDSTRNMDTTLLNSVDAKTIEKYGTALPEDADKHSGINVWGLTAGKQNIRQWLRFKPGDNIIFVPTMDDLIVTEIIQPFRNKDLAKALWGVDKNGITWELMVFLTILGKVKESKRSFLRNLGYPDNDNLQGNRRVTEKFANVYGSIDILLKS